MFLTIRNIDKSYHTAEGPQKVLRGVSFNLDAGSSLALMGESGSGKSTLLHLLAGLDQADSGLIQLGDAELTSLDDTARAALRRGTVGLIFQQFNLIPTLTVASNIAFHAQLSARYDAAWTDKIIAQLGLANFLQRYPEQLSGGQQQRVAIGRTLAAKPRLVLADEPTGNLDEATGDTVLALMLSMVKDTGAALIMATHSQRLAHQLDRQIRLQGGQIAS